MMFGQQTQRLAYVRETSARRQCTYDLRRYLYVLCAERPIQVTYQCTRNLAMPIEPVPRNIRRYWRFGYACLRCIAMRAYSKIVAQPQTERRTP